MKEYFSRMTIGGLLALVVVAALSAQPRQSDQARGFAELLAELRAVRADLNQAASVSLRAQLLVARLSLQEQRITTLGKQLVDLQAQRVAATRERTGAESLIERLTEAAEDGSLSLVDRNQLENEVRVAKSEATRRQNLEQQLRVQEIELAGIVSSEQSRWTEFNGRLDEIERSLPGTAR